MESEKNTTSICYNSTYRHGVDEKRRVQIPAKWRPAEPRTEFTVILWPKSRHGACLRVLPPEEMMRLIADLRAIPNDDPSKDSIKRFIGRYSVQVALDKAGRICLPEDMVTAAGITDKVVLVGLLDRFEIWNPERYEKVIQDDDVLTHGAFNRF